MFVCRITFAFAKMLLLSRTKASSIRTGIGIGDWGRQVTFLRPSRLPLPVQNARPRAHGRFMSTGTSLTLPLPLVVGYLPGGGPVLSSLVDELLDQHLAGHDLLAMRLLEPLAVRQDGGSLLRRQGSLGLGLGRPQQQAQPFLLLDQRRLEGRIFLGAGCPGGSARPAGSWCTGCG